MKNGPENKKTALTHQQEIERFENEGGFIPEIAVRRNQKTDKTIPETTPSTNEKTKDKKTEIEKN